MGPLLRRDFLGWGCVDLDIGAVLAWADVTRYDEVWRAVDYIQSRLSSGGSGKQRRIHSRESRARRCKREIMRPRRRPELRIDVSVLTGSTTFDSVRKGRRVVNIPSIASKDGGAP